jgi:2-oxo-4-hydroxy-4-carboxy-5-ureidoimidazoline decarboxylase
MPLNDFNTLPTDEARARAAACLDVPRWVQALVAGRPYPDLDAVLAVAAREAEHLDDDELAAALARHPRIGERASVGRHDAAHSAHEQAGLDRDDLDVAQRLVEGNRAYEQRFDRVFLIRAAGRDGNEILAELERRLGNDDETERAETVEQLCEIALLRLKGLLD